MARPDDIDHVDFMVADEKVEMRPYQDESRTGSPVSQEAWFDVVELEFCFQEDIVSEKDHGYNAISIRTKGTWGALTYLQRYNMRLAESFGGNS